MNIIGLQFLRTLTSPDSDLEEENTNENDNRIAIHDDDNKDNIQTTIATTTATKEINESYEYGDRYRE